MTNVDLQVLEYLDSTNLEALRQISDGKWCADNGVRGILARSQFGGKGRNGNRWVSKPGNFYFSLICRPQQKLNQWFNLGLVAGVTLVDVFKEILGVSVSLKWPNDLLVDGAKIAGILLEVGYDKNQNPALVVGIGVNLIEAPQIKGRLTLSVWDLLEKQKKQGHGNQENWGYMVLPTLWARIFMGKFAEHLARWETEGFSAFRSDWIAHGVGMGESVIVRLPNQSFQARMLDIDDSGVLLVHMPSGEIRQITSGEVFFGE